MLGSLRSPSIRRSGAAPGILASPADGVAGRDVGPGTRMDDCQRGGWDPSAGGGTVPAADAGASPAPHLPGSLCAWPGETLSPGEPLGREPHRHFTASLFFALSGSLRIRVEPELTWYE